MLHTNGQNGMDRAWLHDGEHAYGIRISGRSERPETEGLSFFAPDFALTEPRPWLIGESIHLEPRPVLGARLPLPHLDYRAEPAPAEFAQLMEDIHTRIGGGEFEKVVPMVTEQLRFGESLHAEMFLPALTLKYAKQFSYGFEFEDEGLCGVTPELLFSVEDGVLKTMALAGTGPAEGPSLLQDPKERHEHEVVIENLRVTLRRWGRVDVGDTEEKIFGALKHLRTPVAVTLSGKPDFAQLVRELHPTAALGGWPRDPAMTWLKAQKFHLSRRRFGAPFGFSDGRRMICVVAIRCIQWHGPNAWLNAGCGVVKESQTLREWSELQLKFGAMRTLLGIEA